VEVRKKPTIITRKDSVCKARKTVRRAVLKRMKALWTMYVCILKRK